MSVELVHVYRGTEVESIHRGDVVGVDSQGKVIFEYGDKLKRTFWRSAAKPIQAIPLVEAGGLDKFNISREELALITSSHGGEAEHEKVLNSLLQKIGKGLEDLDCGISMPMHNGTSKRLLKEGTPFTQANNPCSGKHSGMLALGILKDMELKDYIMPDHPIQREMLKTVSQMAGIDEDHISIAIDGCGVPVHGLPIYNMALAYAKLASGNGGTEERNKALKVIVEAMTLAPFYVAGTRRLDTIIMEETKGRILAKLGAECVYSMSILEEGIGIAVKIEDGNYRALDCIVPELLLKHGYINEVEFKNINDRLPLLIKNHRKQVVGHLKSALK
ncbi:asparaginase [Anaeromicrobium sediminis]|uniref:Asparaginase n=1 Tax=Anaeromicrobium sediminis TaxID=1478221 RepID=A0A267MES0_9FIRM|nr:asparaginase [Anaeromicrobium sediminis]PAB57375.1 hypothetical protein CCE28_18940 [Anaeromicrobium sediminis]